MKLSYKYLTFHVPLWLLRLLKRRMRWVRAAGGIVTAPDHSMLLILRNGRWDLPKGKVEPGETLLQAALREVQEETGIVPHPAGTIPLKTYHIFKWGTRARRANLPKEWGTRARRANFPKGWHLKQTSWFHMTADKQPLVPQLEEGITAAQWVSPDQWHRRLLSSYGTLRTLSQQVQITHLS